MRRRKEPAQTEVSLAPSMALVLYVGAAMDTATPDQRAELRSVLGILKDDSLTADQAYDQARRKVQEVMGEEWRPVGKWDEQIRAFLTNVDEGNEQ